MQNADYSFREFKFAAYARIRISLDGHAAISETQRDASSCGDRFPDNFNHGIPGFFHRHGRHADECINKVSAHILYAILKEISRFVSNLTGDNSFAHQICLISDRFDLSLRKTAELSYIFPNNSSSRICYIFNELTNINRHRFASYC